MAVFWEQFTTLNSLLYALVGTCVGVGGLVGVFAPSRRNLDGLSLGTLDRPANEKSPTDVERLPVSSGSRRAVHHDVGGLINPGLRERRSRGMTPVR